MVCFKRFFTLELSGSLYSNSIFFTYFLFFILIFIITIFIQTTIKLFKFDKLSAVSATTIKQKNVLICYVSILLFFGNIRIRFCSDLVFQKSETKPWPLLLLLKFLLDVCLVIVELVVDIGFVIVLEKNYKESSDKWMWYSSCFKDILTKENHSFFKRMEIMTLHTHQ